MWTIWLLSFQLLSLHAEVLSHLEGPRPSSRCGVKLLRHLDQNRFLDEIKKFPDNSYCSLVSMAWVNYFYAKNSRHSSEAEKLFEQGMVLAERALKFKENDPNALLGWIANAGGFTESNYGISSLFLLPKIVEKLKKLKKIDSDYEWAAADRSLGEIYYKAPSLISVGDMDEALIHAKLAMERFPEFPGNLILWAELMMKKDNDTESRRMLSLFLSMQYQPQFRHEWSFWKSETTRILKELPPSERIPGSADLKK